MRPNYLRPTTLGVGELITQRRILQIPEHQRDYSWENTQVTQFFQDIVIAYKDARSVYFIGTLVLSEPNFNKSEETYAVLDGQQRLVTTTIIYATLRDWFDSHKALKDGDYIQRTFLEYIGMGEKRSPRLLLNKNNQTIYNTYVIRRREENELQNLLKATSTASSNYLVVDAYIRLTKLLQDFISDCEDETMAFRQVTGLVEYLEKNIQAVVLEVPKEENAFTIFEALNARGNELSTLDLVKNNLFSQAGEEYIDQVRACWDSLSNKIELKEADDFLKVFWTSRYGRVRVNQLYDLIRAEINTSRKAYLFAKDLDAASDEYLALTDPRHEIWNRYGDVVAQRIQIINQLSSAQVRWPILAAIQKLSEGQMKELLDILIILAVRYQIVGKRRTGDLEVTLARLARNLHEGRIKRTTQIWEEIRKIIPNDDEFKKDFLKYEERQAKRVAYFLLHLEQTYLNKNKPEYAPFSGLLGFHEIKEVSLPPIDLRLEYVLPKEPNKYWNQEIQGDYSVFDERVYYLGNRFLIEETINFPLTSNFKYIRKLVSESQILLTRQIAEFDTWDRRDIEQRQYFLADLAVKTWPIP